MNNFTSKTVEIWAYSPGDYRLLIKNTPRLARQVNNVLNQYSPDSEFSKSDEVLFKLEDARQIELVKEGSPKMKKILTQIAVGYS